MQAEIRLALQARNPARNIRRAWTVEAGPDLFGAWLVLTRYGRIGARSFADEPAARAHIAAALRRRATSPRRLGAVYDVVTK